MASPPGKLTTEEQLEAELFDLLIQLPKNTRLAKIKKLLEDVTVYEKIIDVMRQTYEKMSYDEKLLEMEKIIKMAGRVPLRWKN